MSDYNVHYEYIKQESNEERVNTITFLRSSKVKPQLQDGLETKKPKAYEKITVLSLIREKVLGPDKDYVITIKDGANFYQRTEVNSNRALRRVFGERNPKMSKSFTAYRSRKMGPGTMQVRHVIRPVYLDEKIKVIIPVQELQS